MSKYDDEYYELTRRMLCEITTDVYERIDIVFEMDNAVEAAQKIIDAS